VTPEQARHRFATARVARLATVDGSGRPHVVPVVFAVLGSRIYSAVDQKPKRTTALQRLANVEGNPAVSLLVDFYDDNDWDALWWVRADGLGRVLPPGDAEARQAVALLEDRYPQHRADPPAGPVLVVEVARWSGWSAR
jgi:PPOX class probable F420-dependent enzyme